MVRKLLDPLGLKALTAVHVQRQSAEDVGGSVLIAQLLHALHVALHALDPDGLHALGGDVQWIGHGHADAPLADVQTDHAHAHTTLMQNWGQTRAQ